MIDFLKNNWMSLLALAISLIALFKDLIKELIIYQKNKKNLKKSKITIKYINKKIVISNYGECSAKNIRVYIDDTPILEHKDFAVFAKQIDFSLLTSQNSIGIKHLEYMGMQTNYKIKVIYDDENKKNNEVEDIVNIF